MSLKSEFSCQYIEKKNCGNCQYKYHEYCNIYPHFLTDPRTQVIKKLKPLPKQPKKFTLDQFFTLK